MTVLLPPADIDFNKAFNYLMLWEDSHPESGKVTEDGGGLTKFGISSHAYPTLDVTLLTLEEAKKIYLDDYWDVKWENTASGYSQSVAQKHFQIKVNLGTTGYEKLIDCIAYIKADKIYDFTSLCIAQLVHYKEKYGTLNKIPTGLRRRALG